MLVGRMQLTSAAGGDLSMYKTAHRTRPKTFSTALEEEHRSLTLFHG